MSRRLSDEEVHLEMDGRGLVALLSLLLVQSDIHRVYHVDDPGSSVLTQRHHLGPAHSFCHLRFDTPQSLHKVTKT